MSRGARMLRLVTLMAPFVAAMTRDDWLYAGLRVRCRNAE
jgi:hypothetical protein